MKCAEAAAAVQAYVDGELTGVDREQIQRHIGACEACARTSLLQGRFKAAVRAHLPRPPVPGDFRRRLYASLEAAATRASAQTAGPGCAIRAWCRPSARRCCCC